MNDTRRAGEAAGAGDGHEGLKLAHIHAVG